MRTQWPIILFAPLLAACAGPEWEGIWYLEIPVLENDACEIDIGENYDDASTADDDTESDWTFTSEEELSPSALFLQVLEDGDNVFVVIEDEIYSGTSEGKMIQVTWSGTEDDLYREEHDDGYLFEQDVQGEVTETITLTIDKENGGVSGFYQITSSTTTAWRESDRWQQNKIGIYTSQVPSYSYLVGASPDNIPDVRDCADDDCELTVESVCDGQVPITGLYAGNHDEGMFAAVEDANRTPGI